MGSAAGELDLRGGHPVLDFVNTVAWRGDAARRIDYLADYSDVVAWCTHAGTVSAHESRVLVRAMRSDTQDAERALARAKRFRESLHDFFVSGASDSLASITEAYVGAQRRRELRRVNGGVVWVERDVTMRSPIDRLTVYAVDLITEIPLDRVKRCSDDACGWMFVDSSHRQNRRWCSAADCGNRDRARRHYDRSRSRYPSPVATNT